MTSDAAMNISLKYRIILTLVPLLALLGLLGGAGSVLLYHLGGLIEAILRENYASVIYMERLNEALERIDSSFQFSLAGQEDQARSQYEQNWRTYEEFLTKEENNITEPGEDELVDKLKALTQQYRRQGEVFYAQPDRDARRRAYFDDGLLATFTRIKDASGAILGLNQASMVNASQRARDTAQKSLIGFGIGLAVVSLLASLAAWRTIVDILRPIRSMTQAALAIGAGNLDQVVPVATGDELGHLADAFNTMARQLRHYRQTDYARLLRAQRTSQATIDSFPDPVIVVDEEGLVAMANPAAQRILGVTSHKTDGQPCPAWDPPETLRQPLQEAVRQQARYLPQEFDRAVLLRVDAQEHAFLPRILPIADPYGNTLGAAVLLEDVTRFRLLDQLKSDLVATVSHELKTPLTSIQLAVHLLLEEAAGPLSPKQTELLLDARDNAERLLARINNLLDLTRLEQRGKLLDLRPESPATLLGTAADTIRPRAEDKAVEVVVDVPSDLPRVAADAQRLGNALDNLLINALTYTPRGGRITLSAAQTGDTVTLTIADTGVGIPPEHLPRVFDKFFRVPGQSKGSGTGLGLAIVREIVTAHGGTVQCESRPGEGSVFRLALPVWKGEDDAAA